MIPYERQQKILSIIEGKELIKIDELQQEIPDVSLSTLRRDLKLLEKHRKIELLSGGAVKKITAVGEIPVQTRATLYGDEKEKIAVIAAQYIKDGDVIYLDSGTTCTQLFKNIQNRRITIYTSNTDIFALTHDTVAELYLLGGKFNPLNNSVSGSLTEDILRNLYFNKAFLGANGVDEKSGITTPTVEEATKKRMVKEHSDQVYVLCDSSKFHSFSNVVAFDLDDIILISDKNDEKIGEIVSVVTQ